MQYQRLGKLGLFVSRLGFGSATFGGANHPVYSAIGGLPQSEADRLIGIALDGGNRQSLNLCCVIAHFVLDKKVDIGQFSSYASVNDQFCLGQSWF